MPGMHPQVTHSLLKALDEDISQVNTYVCAVFL